MAEYTYKDIIIDPTSEEAKNAVGKICYFSNSPRNILSDIYCKSAVEGILTNMDDGYFEVDNEGYWDCIILKKEEPKKYVPFENGQEFFNSYLSVESRLEKEDYFLSNHGIWLKDKTSKAYYMVTKIWDIGDDSDEISWKELLEYYTFLDDSPCGKEVEE